MILTVIWILTENFAPENWIKWGHAWNEFVSTCHPKGAGLLWPQIRPAEMRCSVHERCSHVCSIDGSMVPDVSTSIQSLTLEGIIHRTCPVASEVTNMGKTLLLWKHSQCSTAKTIVRWCRCEIQIALWPKFIGNDQSANVTIRGLSTRRSLKIKTFRRWNSI